MGQSATVGDVVDVLEDLYPTRLAADWDAVGLVTGDLDQPVGSVLFAVDTVQAVADEARALGADLVVAHHPLFLRPVHSVATSHPKGRLLHGLVASSTALYVAHTNADSPPGGVSDALAARLGLTGTRPLVPYADPPMDKIVVFVPHGHTQRLLDALAAAGAGSIGDYDRAAFTTSGTGTFRPSEDARPYIGESGTIEELSETRLEMVLPRDRRRQVVAAMRSNHPYEEPAYDVIELADNDGAAGLGRIGVLEQPVTLRHLVDRLLSTLPATASGARVAGDLDAEVSVVALQGGAGDDLLDVVRAASPDVYVTSDLRHHPAIEFREFPAAAALVDIPHWAAEWCWLPVVERLVVAAMRDAGVSLRTHVSVIPTDPWNDVIPHPGSSRSRS